MIARDSRYRVPANDQRRTPRSSHCCRISGAENTSSRAPTATCRPGPVHSVQRRAPLRRRCRHFYRHRSAPLTAYIASAREWFHYQLDRIIPVWQLYRPAEWPRYARIRLHPPPDLHAITCA